MKVASWNVARRNSWREQVRLKGFPDVLLLQEVQDPTGLEVPGMWSLGAEIDERGRRETWGNAIVSKFPLTPVQLDSEYKGSLLAATVNLPDGRLMGLVNIYGLLERSPKNPDVKYVHFGVHRMLSDVGFWLAAAQGPYVDGFIVAGDFNKDRAMDGGTSKRTGRQIASNIFNRFGDFDMHEVEPPLGITYRHSSSKSTWHLDHFFISSALQESSAMFDYRSMNPSFGLSDHMPIGVEISPTFTD